MRKQILSVFIGLVFVCVFMNFVYAASPSGAGNVTEISTQRAPVDNPENHSAMAGNITELFISGFTTTQAWQGYFGNITGTIQLADSNDNQMYDWALASPQGEIYASTADSITWGSIGCFNFTANGTALEDSFNISSTDQDGINETFVNNNHDEFYTNNIQIAEDDCMSVQLYDSTGASVDQNFEEVILWDGANAVFATILENDLSGFDSTTHDFQMIVPEDGHSSDTDTTPYYFYVELE